MSAIAPSPVSPGRIVPPSERKLKNHTSFGQSVRNTFTMAYRGLVKVRRTPEQLIDVTVQPIIFTLMFGYLFGGAIAGNVQSYLPLLIPGILVQTVITTSVVTGVQLREDMDKGVFDRFRSLPIVPHGVRDRDDSHVRDGLHHGIPAARRILGGRRGRTARRAVLTGDQLDLLVPRCRRP